MNEMLERVARALCIEEHIDPDASDQWAHGVNRPNWESRIEGAKFAIRAMREPTEAMVKVAIDKYRFLAVGFWADLWNDLIDEALK